MISRLTLLAGAIPVLGLWWAICTVAVRVIHPASLFPALLLFLASLAISAYRLRTPSADWRTSRANGRLSTMVDSRLFKNIGPTHRATDGAACLMLIIFGWHALTFIPSIGVGMAAAAFCPEEEKNPLL
jgi:hypothetical protein